MTLTEFNKCLLYSPHASLDEARHFIEWYNKSQYFTSWDETRKAWADLLVEADKHIPKTLDGQYFRG